MANAAISAESKGMSRREFLYYIWGASLALYAAQFTGLLVWFLIPRFREGEFGGKFPLALEAVPPINAAPVNVPDGRFWLVNLDASEPNDRMSLVQDDPAEIRGVAAIYKVCTHLGCIYSWTPANERFECPCHGSKYRLDGRRIEDPAPRSLDRFRVEALDANGAIIAASEPDENNFYKPLVIPDGTVALQIDTGDRLQGPTQTLICDFNGNCP